MTYFGIDVHSRTSDICEISESGEVLRRVRIRTTREAFEEILAGVGSSGIAVEASAQSAWLSRLLTSLGHQVTIVNPRRMRLIADSSLKTDASDAELLARVLRSDPILLRSVHARSEAAQFLRGALRVRSSLVRARVSQINTLRGIVRSHGKTIRATTAARLLSRFAELELPQELREILDPVVEMIVTLNGMLSDLDQKLKLLSHKDEVTHLLQTAPGVGPVVSTGFKAWVDDPARFRRSRDVGPCLGLRPDLHGSGDRFRRGRITREGDTEMRRLLVQAAHVILVRGPDCALRRWATGLAERKGHKKAVVALARKLAVVLHRMWVTGEAFEPFPQTARSRIPSQLPANSEGDDLLDTRTSER